MGMGVHGEWQTCNDSLTICECHSPNGYANDHRCYCTALLSHLGQVEWLKWTDPLSLSHLSHKDQDPLLLVPLVPLRSEDPVLLVPLVPRLQLVPTCRIWLYHLSFANSLFSDFFLGSSHCHSIFRKTHLNEKFSSKYYHVGEGINDNQIYGKLTFLTDLSPLCQ